MQSNSPINSQKVCNIKSSNSSSLKVIKTCTIAGKLNVTVRLFKSPEIPQFKSLPKLSFSSSAETLINAGNKPRTVYVDIKDLKPTNPSDFIEPPQNLAIPNTQEYMKHTIDVKNIDFHEDYSVFPKSYSSKIDHITRSRSKNVMRKEIKAKTVLILRSASKISPQPKKKYLL